MLKPYVTKVKSGLKVIYGYKGLLKVVLGFNVPIRKN